MEGIYSWVKDILFFMIFVTVVSHLVPNNKYEKYIRLFTGMILIMIVIKPVSEVFPVDGRIDESFFGILENEIDISWNKEAMEEELEGVQEKQIMEEYERQVTAYIENEAKRLGVLTDNVRAVIVQTEDGIVVESISMEADVVNEEKRIDEITIPDIVIEEKMSQTEKEEIIMLKTSLAQYYGLEESQVLISGR